MADMTVCTTEFAHAGTLTDPGAIKDNGFACGPANPYHFNWLFNCIHNQMVEINAANNVNSGSPASGLAAGSII